MLIVKLFFSLTTALLPVKAGNLYTCYNGSYVSAVSFTSNGVPVEQLQVALIEMTIINQCICCSTVHHFEYSITAYTSSSLWPNSSYSQTIVDRECVRNQWQCQQQFGGYGVYGGEHDNRQFLPSNCTIHVFNSTINTRANCTGFREKVKASYCFSDYCNLGISTVNFQIEKCLTLIFLFEIMFGVFQNHYFTIG